MRQITVRQARRELSEAKVKEWLPCEIVSDGKVIAMLVKPYDVALAAQRRRKQPDKPSGELRYSKSAQAAGRMR